jgi:glycosyltransferase involved in cell wall biosynthesis
MLRVLFLAPYPEQAASTRFRATQFFPYLREHGVHCDLSSLLTAEQFGTFYSRRGRVGKARSLLTGAIQQTLRTLTARHYDIVVVQRGALLFGPPVLEWLVAKTSGASLVFDFDDAIWLADPVSAWGWLARATKFPSKVAHIVRLASHVIVCNSYTRDYARQFKPADAVSVIPTVVDADIFAPATRRETGVPVVGWIGTHSTAQYLDAIIEPLRQVRAKHEFILKIVGSGRDWLVPGLDILAQPWTLETETNDYQSLDIGLYPVRDDEWGHGKTGFKPVVYMATGAACVASPVGGVLEFLRHGRNGFLASSRNEWRDSVSALLEDHGLRRRIASEARTTVTDWYCLRVQAPRLLSILERTAGG